MDLPQLPHPPHPKDIFFFPKGGGFNGRRLNRFLEEILVEHFDEWATEVNKKVYVKAQILPKIRNAYYGSKTSFCLIESNEVIATLISNKFHYYKRLKKIKGEISFVPTKKKPAGKKAQGTLPTQ